MLKFNKKVLEILNSKRFYYFIIILFIFEACWIAFTARYPMAFDEDFHYGIIKLYAHQYSPIFAHQPSNSSQFGALTRDPSYLYHYLLSYPFRIFNYLFKNDTSNIIFLRILNIAMFTAAIVVYKNLFNKYLKLTNSLVNTILLFFVLTPIVPLLAAQINYDNLLVLCSAVTFTLAYKFIGQIKNSNYFDIKTFILLFSICMLSSLVQYAFLPIFVTTFVYILIIIVKSYKYNSKKLINSLRSSFKKLKRPIAVILAVIFIVSLGLFLEKDGYNTIKYHTPVPDCSKVLSVNECKLYAPWQRNYTFETTKSRDIDYNLINYSFDWFHNYFFYSLFYSLNGSAGGYTLGGPLPLIQVVGVLVFFTGVVLFIIYHRKIFKNNNLLFYTFIVSSLYLLTLWIQNYSDFLKTGFAVAEQGRYLIVILLPSYALVAISFRQFLVNYKRYKPILTIAILLIFLQGGGITTYMLTSDSTWYWQNSNAVNKVGSEAQKVIKHVIVHHKSSTY